MAQFSEGENDTRLELCRPCEVVPPDFERAIAFGVYEGPLRSLIHLLKYDRMEPVARKLAKTLAGQVAELCAGLENEVLVVPVPLHRSKRRARGFNQAELLANGVVSSVRRTAPAVRLKLAGGMLERKRATQSQSILTTKERRRNLRGAFFVPDRRAQYLAGRDVLVIDDIYTTGATARACSKALKAAGAERVWVATVARAQREGVALWDAGALVVPTGLTPVWVAGS